MQTKNWAGSWSHPAAGAAGIPWGGGGGGEESYTNFKQQQQQSALEAFQGDLGVEGRAHIQQILSVLHEGNDPEDNASPPPPPHRLNPPPCLYTFAETTSPSFVDGGKESSAAESGPAFPLRCW